MKNHVVVGLLAAQLAAFAWWSSGIRPASAAGQGPQRLGGTLDVATETCTATTQPSGATFVYAQHAYPGMSAAQLSQVRSIGHAPQTGVVSPSYRLPSYPFAGTEGFVTSGPLGGIPSVYVRDGVVAVLCGTPGAPWFDSVTFTLVE